MGFLGKLRWEKQKLKQRAHYEEELKHSGDLLYTWQYDIRWAATELRKTGFMIEATESPRGLWQLK